MKNRRCFIAALCCLVGILNTSCGLIHPPERQNGYLTSHFYSCGPTALQKALKLYSDKHGVEFKQSIERKQLSIEIQDNTVLFDLREFLTLLDKKAAEITWPQEIKNSLKLRGISVREIKNLNIPILLAEKFVAGRLNTGCRQPDFGTFLIQLKRRIYNLIYFGHTK